MQNCLSGPEQIEGESMKTAVVAVKECEHEKLRQCREMVKELEPVQVEFIQKAKKKGCAQKLLVFELLMNPAKEDVNQNLERRRIC